MSRTRSVREGEDQVDRVGDGRWEMRGGGQMIFEGI